jgi:DNA-binding MarR family transcriptional regulator
LPQAARITPPLSDADYARLLKFRTTLRAFEHWSSDRAGRYGLTGTQHQLLLAVRGHRGSAGPTIGEAARHLLVRHNTAVELVDRTQDLGLLERRRDPDDRRVVRLRLTRLGRARLAQLSTAHLEELTRLAGLIDELLAELGDTRAAG